MFARRSIAIGLVLLIVAVMGCSNPPAETSTSITTKAPGGGAATVATSPTATVSAPPEATTPADVAALVFAFGVGAQNVLDTAAGTFTKDMIMASPITVPMRLTEEEMARIARKIDAIDFFSYPATYTTPEDGGGWMEPHQSYRFSVTTAEGAKTVTWEDAVFNDDERAADLRGLARLIERIIHARPEYKALPEPKGAYL
jgi:hypothetical protein